MVTAIYGTKQNTLQHLNIRDNYVVEIITLEQREELIIG